VESVQDDSSKGDPPPASSLFNRFAIYYSRIAGKISFAKIIVLSYATLILILSVLIYLSEKGTLSYIDSFYIASASVCVTGITPVPLSQLSAPTHWIILFGIQLGGIWIIIFSVMIGILILRGESRNTAFHKIVRDLLDFHEDEKAASNFRRAEVRRILFSIVNISVTIEILGAVLIYHCFPEELPPGVNRYFFSLFTSISAFNNAGFSIIDDLTIISGSPLSLYIVSFLIILGGIGFPVIIYLEKWGLTALQKVVFHIESRLETLFYSKIIKNPNRHSLPRFYESMIRFSYSLDTKIENYNLHLYGESNRIQYRILLYGTIFLLAIGTVSFLFFEWDNPHTLYGLKWDLKLANSFFLSACSRTAGFTSLDIMGMQDPSIIIVTMLMFIGGGPQGTAGGIRITTIAILLVYLRNVIHPSSKVCIFGETISKNSVAISIRIYFLATTLLAVLFIIFVILNQGENSLHVIFFELMAVFSTTGFSIGLTQILSESEKIFCIFVMIIGRVGVFNFLIALTGHSGVPRMGVDDGIRIQVG